ncbi:MAG TPA: mechanosensitive ion channel protein MscS [Pusillimonas sp.]|jgi:MscS family membrane protein|nr:mechanosensitive ion channel protein MscS [Pusillimonas sp.]|tara:strand:- start:113368 stop:114504 length:1137 start_codon:yes stop_codon:yes gene_type:complete
MEEEIFTDISRQISEWTGSGEMVALTIQVFLVVLTVVIANFFLRRILNKLESRSHKTRTYWDDALIEAARKPVTIVAWIVGLSFAVEILQVETEVTLLDFIGPVRIVGIVGCITWFVVRFINNVEKGIIAQKQARNEPIDVTTVDAVGKLLRVSVLITAVLVAMQSLGFSISGLLAFGGIGGLAVSFAAKDLLANFFGGLMIYLDRPFAVGDWIRSDDRQIEGTVEEIGWRLTRIRTFDKRPLYVPNGIFTQIAVENPSRMTNRRISEIIGVRYDDFAHVAAIINDIKEMLRSHPEIDQDQTLIVNFLQYGPSSLDIMVYTFTRTTVWVTYHEVKQDVLLKIGEIIEGYGAEIAFPTQTLHLMSGEAQEERRADPASA